MHVDFNPADYQLGIERRQKLLHERGCKCKRCGLSPLPYNMAEMHHRNPKEKAFTLDIRTLHNLLMSPNRLAVEKLIKREAAKCDLLCQPCHKKVHATLDPQHFDAEYLRKIGVVTMNWVA